MSNTIFFVNGIMIEVIAAIKKNRTIKIKI
jgi:hypothetical protein